MQRTQARHHPIHDRHHSNTALAMRPLAAAICSALLGMALTTATLIPHTVFAADAAISSSKKHYAIPAGSLSQSLYSFASSAGITLSFDPALTEGLRSNGLNGSYAVLDGLNALLANSGLVATPGQSGGYLLGKRPASDSVLPAVTVSSERSATTEGTDSYTSGSMSTATGLSLSQRHTPQTVSVISRQQMDDFNLTTLQEIAKVTPGIYSKGQAVSDQETNYYARGFALTHVNVDGLPVDVSGFNERNVSADMIMYDRVEVVRGATGLMEGAGAPAGSINLVRKRPTVAPLFNASVSVGSWNNKQLTVDTSRALNESGSLRGRVAASWRDSDSFVDVVNTKNYSVYGILEADLSPDTTLGVGFSQQRTRTDGVFMGLPTYTDGSHMNLPRSTFLNNADSFQDRDNDVYFADLETRLNGGWRSKFAVTHISAESASRYANNFRIPGQTFQRRQSDTGWGYSTQQVVADMRVTGPIELFGRQHEMIAGISYRNDTSDAYQTWDSSTSRIVDIGNWNPYANAVSGGPAAPYNWDRKTREKGLYTAANFNLSDALKLVIGGRFGWYTQDVTGWYGTTKKWRRSLDESAKFIPYLGLVYDVDKQHSLYASATQIFQPQSAMDVSGNTLNPLEGTNLEVGIKGEYFGGQLNTSAAIFRITQTNRAVRDEQNCPTGGAISCSRAAGEILSEGVDLQISGSPLPGWQIAGGYTYVAAKYTKDGNPNNIGKPVATDEPRHLFKLYTNYRLPGSLDKWNVGASAYAQGKTSHVDIGYNTVQGAYAIFGLMAGYKVNDNIQLKLNIDNIFDRAYYQSLDYGWSGGLARYGAPRNALLTLNYKM